MSGFSWPLPPPVSASTGFDFGGFFPGNQLTFNKAQEGLKSFKLINLDGEVDMRPNEMDIIFFNGSVVQFESAVLVLDQRVRKSVAEVQGQNQFAPGWGSIITQYVGAKIVDTSTLRDIGQSVADMFEALIALQNVTKRRLALEPAELIESVDKIKVVAEGTVITVSVNVVTQAKTVEEIFIPGAFDVVQAGGPGGTAAAA